MQIAVQSGGIIEHVGKEKCYEYIARAGFTAIDWQAVEHALPKQNIRELKISGSIYERPVDEVIAHFEEEAALIHRHGLTITQAHAPFPAYIAGHPELLDIMIEVYLKVIRVCDRYGCKNLVVHGASLSLSDEEQTLESVWDMNMRLYSAMIPTLLECNVTVCLENLVSKHAGYMEAHCTDPYEAVRMIDTLNEMAGREVFGFCLDIGHMALAANDFRKYVPILGKRIKALHIHDNDCHADSHLAPLTGKIPWKTVCKCLRQIGYSGDLSFETFRQAETAIMFDEELLLPWLNLIRQTGEVFRKHIRAE